MPESGLFKAGEALEPVRVDRGTGSHIALDELIESGALEVWDDRHPYPSKKNRMALGRSWRLWKKLVWYIQPIRQQ